jgi:hypothetical protein
MFASRWTKGFQYIPSPPPPPLKLCSTEYDEVTVFLVVLGIFGSLFNETDWFQEQCHWTYQEQRCVSNTWLLFITFGCVLKGYEQICIQYMTVLFITFGFVCYRGMNRVVYPIHDCTIHYIWFRVLQGYEQRCVSSVFWGAWYGAEIRPHSQLEILIFSKFLI